MKVDVPHTNNVRFELTQNLFGRYVLVIVRPQVSVREVKQ